MENFLAPFLSFILLYKYVGLFAISFLGAFLFPVPSASALAAAGAFASQKYLNFSIVLLVALLGNIAGDATGYLIARRYGREVLHKIGFKKILHSSQYHVLEDYTKDFSYSLIFFTRFLPEIGSAVNVIAGLAKISYRNFFIVDLIGESCFVSLYGFAGFFLGSQWSNNIWFFIEAGLVILSFGVIIGLIQYGLFRFRRTR